MRARVCACAYVVTYVHARVYVYVIIRKTPKVITPMWVGVGHVWKYYTELKRLLSLDIIMSTVEADTTVSDSPLQFFIVLLEQLLVHT